MTIKILAVDTGLTSTGLAVLSLEDDGPRLVAWKCLHTEPQAKKKNIYVAHDDILRAVDITKGIMEFYCEHECRAMVCELAMSGSRDNRAARAIGIVTGLMSAIWAALRCPAEWITPDESRIAGGWDKEAHKIPKIPRGISAEEKAILAARNKKQKAENTKAIKETVMGRMSIKYPELAGIAKKDKEHICDALATFEAARERQMVRTLAGTANV